MQVGILTTAPLPGGVKVARRFVKPHGVGASPTLAANSGCNVSSRRPCSERGGRRCNSCHPDHFWKAGRYKLAAPVLKTGSARTEVGALPTPSASFRKWMENFTRARNLQKRTRQKCREAPRCGQAWPVVHLR